jgi:formylglycine-generating enzyme required for sulfatase activity
MVFDFKRTFMCVASAAALLSYVIGNAQESLPNVTISVSRVMVTQNVEIGRDYVLESSFDMVTWTEAGPQFTADSESIETEFEVDVAGRYFRLLDLGEGNANQLPDDPVFIPELDMKLMPIPAGTFVMGSPDDEEGRWDSEGPRVTVTISKPFWVGQTEVTQGQWKTIMGNNPSRFKGGDQLPVERVSWDDAVAFCDKLNQDYGNILPAGYRYTLPTEAQWEYACRAGTTTRFYYGDDPEYAQLPHHAWFFENSTRTTHPVAEKRANAWSLHDMQGNVSEWCLDYYEAYSGGERTDPKGPQSGAFRVIRGGCYLDARWFCRSAFRGGLWYDHPFFTPGFRVALSPLD